MRRVFSSVLFAAAIALPAAASAAPKQGVPVDQAGTRSPSSGSRVQSQPQNGNNPQGDSSLGGGAVGGNEPGHVTGPGTTPPDNDSRGPINDVDAGRGTNDTHQSKKPKPAR
jgi:hypothetical protein